MPVTAEDLHALVDANFPTNSTGLPVEERIPAVDARTFLHTFIDAVMLAEDTVPGGPQTLAAILNVGNVSGGHNLIVSDGDKLGMTRGAKTIALIPAATVTENRTITLPDGDGELALAADQVKSRWLQPVDGFADTPTGSETAGARYIVGTGTDAFSGHDGDEAQYDGTTWTFATTLDGDAVKVIGDYAVIYHNEGGAWVARSSDVDLSSLATLVDLANAIIAHSMASDPHGDRTYARGLVTNALRYVFSVSTGDADPGAGLFRLNNASIGSVTYIYLDALDAQGNDVLALLDSLSTARIILKQVGGNGLLVLQGGTVVTASGYRKIPVTVVQGAIPGIGTTWELNFNDAPGYATQAYVDARVAKALVFAFDANTTDGDPGTGNWRFDDASIGSVTKLFIDTSDRAGNELSDYFDALTTEQITMKELSGNGLLILNVTGVTAGSGYRKIAVTVVEGDVPTVGNAWVFSFAGGGGGGSAVVSKAVYQVSHGLSVGELIKLSGSTYAQAKADVIGNAHVIGLVTVVADVDNFTFVPYGIVAGFTGLTAGAQYWLDATTAGAATATIPDGVANAATRVYVAISATEVVFRPMPPLTVDSIQVIIPTPENGSLFKMRFSRPGKVLGLRQYCTTGGFATTVTINATNVTSLVAVTATSTEALTAATGANTGVVGDELEVVVSSSSTPAAARVIIYILPTE